MHALFLRFYLVTCVAILAWQASPADAQLSLLLDRDFEANAIIVEPNAITVEGIGAAQGMSSMAVTFTFTETSAVWSAKPG